MAGAGKAAFAKTIAQNCELREAAKQRAKQEREAGKQQKLAAMQQAIARQRTAEKANEEAAAAKRNAQQQQQQQQQTQTQQQQTQHGAELGDFGTCMVSMEPVHGRVWFIEANGEAC